MDMKSIRGLTPQHKALIPYQLPDEESYLEVLYWRDRVVAKKEKFELSKIDCIAFDATILHAGKIVLLFTWNDGLLRFYYCEREAIVETKYVDRIARELPPGTPAPQLISGVEWDVIREPKGLVAYSRTPNPAIFKIEFSKQAIKFCERFPAVTAKVKSKKSKASEDEDGVLPLDLHLIPDGGPK